MGVAKASESPMKIFALYANVELVKEPDWLDDFLKKYQPHGLHVTLKQPCFIADESIAELKSKVSEFFRVRRDAMKIVFDELFCSRDRVGAIMVFSSDAEDLMRLQRDLCNTLSGYRDYVEAEREKYEKNFRPHITIGDEIPEEQYKESLEYLNKGCLCEGRITEVVLAVVSDMSTEESNNPANKIMYGL